MKKPIKLEGAALDVAREIVQLKADADRDYRETERDLARQLELIQQNYDVQQRALWARLTTVLELTDGDKWSLDARHLLTLDLAVMIPPAEGRVCLGCGQVHDEDDAADDKADAAAFAGLKFVPGGRKH